MTALEFNSCIITHLVTHLVWPPTSRTTSQRGIGLSGSIHEEAHLDLSYCIQSIFKSINTGSPNYCWSSIFHLLTTLLEKNTSDSPECTSFYLILACPLVIIPVSSSLLKLQIFCMHWLNVLYHLFKSFIYSNCPLWLQTSFTFIWTLHICIQTTYNLDVKLVRRTIN